MPIELTIPDKIIHLKGIDIFKGLSVGELAAVASIAEEQEKKPKEIVIREGDLGQRLYLMIEGEVSVIKGYQTDQHVELDRIHASDYFGEMALFEDDTRSATIQTESLSRFLTLHKMEFREIVREYPQIGMHALKALSSRLRKFNHKVAECDFPEADL